jgi:hypothetical protein
MSMLRLRSNYIDASGLKEATFPLNADSLSAFRVPPELTTTISHFTIIIILSSGGENNFYTILQLMYISWPAQSEQQGATKSKQRKLWAIPASAHYYNECKEKKLPIHYI